MGFRKTRTADEGEDVGFGAIYLKENLMGTMTHCLMLLPFSVPGTKVQSLTDVNAARSNTSNPDEAAILMRPTLPLSRTSTRRSVRPS